MKLHIIRHLPTEWNKKGLLQGTQDVSICLPLEKEETRRINKNLTMLLPYESYDKILVSRLQRTHQTAEQYNAPITGVEPLLDELNFGTFEGKKKKLLWERKDWIDNPRSMELGERLVELEGRVYTFLRQYHECNHILLFGHGSWIRALLSIQKSGDISLMNKVTVQNNQLITLAKEKNFVWMMNYEMGD